MMNFLRFSMLLSTIIISPSSNQGLVQAQYTQYGANPNAPKDAQESGYVPLASFSQQNRYPNAAPYGGDTWYQNGQSPGRYPQVPYPGGQPQGPHPGGYPGGQPQIPNPGLNPGGQPQPPNPGGVPGVFVTFPPYWTAKPTPIPFQPLVEAQPITIPSTGMPKWILRYLLLNMIKKFSEETTTTTTTVAAPYTFPTTFAGWYKYGNCAYKSYLTPKTWDQADAECKGLGARLATINVKQTSPRTTIFGQVSLSSTVAWVGLVDEDGSTTTYAPRWLDFATFVAGSNPPTYSTSAGTRSCAKVGVSPIFAFADCSSETQNYLCEFCPTL